MNFVDTSGWIEYFFGGSNAAFFTEPIENTDELIVPVVCLYIEHKGVEFYFKRVYKLGRLV